VKSIQSEALLDNISSEIMRFNAICIKMHPICGYPKRNYWVDFFYNGHKHNGTIDETHSGNLQMKILNRKVASFAKG
jgi:hypothetical protein